MSPYTLLFISCSLLQIVSVLAKSCLTNMRGRLERGMRGWGGSAEMGWAAADIGLAICLSAPKTRTVLATEKPANLVQRKTTTKLQHPDF
jgi:hypothetical protein